MGSMTSSDHALPEDRATEAGDGPVRELDWWHRDHPTFIALAGFFTGMIFVTAVPGALVALLRLLLTYEQAERLAPFISLALVVPVGLVAHPRTRRFGKYMWVGMLLTLLVVGGVASVVLYVLVRQDG